MPNVARMPLIKCYRMLQNARVTVFTVSELIRENQQLGVGNFTPPPQPRLGEYGMNLIDKLKTL